MTPEKAPTDDPLVWQGHGGTKYHREDCRLLNRNGAVSWRRSFAAGDYENGMALDPCRVCRPEIEDVPA
jgi:hypothetical protein